MTGQVVLPGGQNSLDGLCRRFNIDLGQRTKHGALLDAELLADVYAEMMGVGANQRNLMFGGSQQAEAEFKEVLQLTPTDAKIYEARDFGASEEEKQAHKEFVEGLGSEFWQQVENA